jgi:hypothetical protein
MNRRDTDDFIYVYRMRRLGIYVYVYMYAKDTNQPTTHPLT